MLLWSLAFVMSGCGILNDVDDVVVDEKDAGADQSDAANAIPDAGPGRDVSTPDAAGDTDAPDLEAADMEAAPLEAAELDRNVDQCGSAGTWVPLLPGETPAVVRAGGQALVSGSVYSTYSVGWASDGRAGVVLLDEDLSPLNIGAVDIGAPPGFEPIDVSATVGQQGGYLTAEVTVVGRSRAYLCRFEGLAAEMNWSGSCQEVPSLVTALEAAEITTLQQAQSVRVLDNWSLFGGRTVATLVGEQSDGMLKASAFLMDGLMLDKVLGLPSPGATFDFARVRPVLGVELSTGGYPRILAAVKSAEVSRVDLLEIRSDQTAYDVRMAYGPLPASIDPQLDTFALLARNTIDLSGLDVDPSGSSSTYGWVAVESPQSLLLWREAGFLGNEYGRIQAVQSEREVHRIERLENAGFDSDEWVLIESADADQTYLSVLAWDVALDTRLTPSVGGTSWDRVDDVSGLVGELGSILVVNGEKDGSSGVYGLRLSANRPCP